MNRLTRMLITATVGMAMAVPAIAAEQWTMATPYPDSNYHTQNIQKFADQVEKNTDIDITIYSNGSLIKHPQIKRAVQTGQVQLGGILSSIISNENPLFALYSVPFLATNYKQSKKLWEDSKPAIEKYLDSQGLKLLFSIPWPPQGLYVSKPVNDVADLKGLKFRAYNASTAKIASLLGMIPTQVEVPEVPQAFSTGMVEAMMTSPTTGVNTKAWDYVNRFYDLQAWIPRNMVMINKKAFEALPKQAQEAVLQAAKDAQTRGVKMRNDAYTAEIKILKDHGVKVLKPSAKLMKQFHEVGKEMIKDWLKKTGAEGKKIIDTYRQQ